VATCDRSPLSYSKKIMAAERRPGSRSEIDVAQRLTVCVAHDETVGREFSGPRRGKASFSHSNGSKPSERWLPFSISGSSALNGGAICRHNCRTSKRAQFGENQNCLMWKGIVWSEWQDLNLRPPRPERGGAASPVGQSRGSLHIMSGSKTAQHRLSHSTLVDACSRSTPAR
jgi:hypothetical protein